jgi:hypothetical protein
LLAIEARVKKVRKKRLQLVRIHRVYPQGCELFALEDGGLVAPLVAIRRVIGGLLDAIPFE